jgi:hypothetical protein
MLTPIVKPIVHTGPSPHAPITIGQKPGKA